VHKYSKKKIRALSSPAQYIIPLTKEVEVEYLLHRLDANGTHQSTEFFAHLYPPDALKNGQQ
jgi:hypothetical protein